MKQYCIGLVIVGFLYISIDIYRLVRSVLYEDKDDEDGKDDTVDNDPNSNEKDEGDGNALFAPLTPPYICLQNHIDTCVLINILFSFVNKLFLSSHVSLTSLSAPLPSFKTCRL